MSPETQTLDPEDLRINYEAVLKEFEIINSVYQHAELLDSVTQERHKALVHINEECISILGGAPAMTLLLGSSSEIQDYQVEEDKSWNTFSLSILSSGEVEFHGFNRRTLEAGRLSTIDPDATIKAFHKMHLAVGHYLGYLSNGGIGSLYEGFDPERNYLSEAETQAA